MSNQKITNLNVTIFSYILTLFLGWQILSFIHVFMQLNPNRIAFSYQQWMNTQIYYLPLVSVIMIMLLTSLTFNASIKLEKYPLNYNAFSKLKIGLAILLLGSFINYALYIFNLNKNIIELLNVLCAVFCLIQLSKIFFDKRKSAWYHPTTQSTFYISAAMLGISQMIIFETATHSFNKYAYSLLILIILEMLRIFTRFKYLTKYSFETNLIARSLLGKYGIYFGVRVVAGIFMPLVYILYALYANDQLIQGVGVLLIVGEFMERLLFVYISNTSQTPIQNETKI